MTSCAGRTVVATALGLSVSMFMCSSWLTEVGGHPLRADVIVLSLFSPFCRSHAHRTTCSEHVHLSVRTTAVVCGPQPPRVSLRTCLAIQVVPCRRMRGLERVQASVLRSIGDGDGVGSAISCVSIPPPSLSSFLFTWCRSRRWRPGVTGLSA